MLFSGANPTQALIIFSSMARCFDRAFTTGVPGGTCFHHLQPFLDSEMYSNHHMKVQGFRWGCVKTYKRSFCKVTEDGGHRMERVKLSLQIKPFHHLFRFISKWKTDDGLGFC